MLLDFLLKAVDETKNERLRVELQQLRDKLKEAEDRYSKMLVAMADLRKQAAATQRRYGSAQRAVVPIRERNTDLLQETSEVDSQLKRKCLSLGNSARVSFLRWLDISRGINSN